MREERKGGYSKTLKRHITVKRERPSFGLGRRNRYWKEKVSIGVDKTGGSLVGFCLASKPQCLIRGATGLRLHQVGLESAYKRPDFMGGCKIKYEIVKTWKKAYRKRGRRRREVQNDEHVR